MTELPINQIICGDNLETMRTWPSNSIHCCVTSPPYWGLRDYGHDGQIGLEETPEKYVTKLVKVFQEVKRVLRDDGTLWLNLGDSYAAGKCGRADQDRNTRNYDGRNTANAKNTGAPMYAQRNTPEGLKPKDLVGIPWRVAFALQADGWYLRQDIIWHKPNPMPESVRDRCTKSHEYVFLLTKSERYYYDAEAVKEPLSAVSIAQIEQAERGDIRQGIRAKALVPGQSMHKGGLCGAGGGSRGAAMDRSGRNRRSVWTITTKPYSGAHFAVMPPDLVEPCIKAGTSEEGCCPACGKPWERVLETPKYPKELRAMPGDDGVKVGYGHKQVNTTGSGQAMQNWRNANPPLTTGWRPACTCGGSPVPCTVLDPFMGSGTVAMVARNLSCRYVGCELNPEYVAISQKRLTQGVLF